jgi:hypothetical protein
VTVPNGIVAGSSQRPDWSYGNALLSLGGLRPDGTVVFKPGGGDEMPLGGHSPVSRW